MTVEELDNYYLLRRNFGSTRTGVNGGVYGIVRKGRKYYTVCKFVGSKPEWYGRGHFKVYCHYAFKRSEIELLIKNKIITLHGGVTL